jgi:hypothetical protein
MMRVYQFTYASDLAPLGDLRTLVDRGETLGAYATWMPNGTSFVGQLNVSTPFTPGAPLDDDHLLRDLSRAPSDASVMDLGYPDWVTLVDKQVAQLDAALNYEKLVKPWFDVWLNDSAVERYLGDVLSELDPRDLAPGTLLLLIPARRTGVEHPFFMGPEEDSKPSIYLFDILDNSFGPEPDPAFVSGRLQRNAMFYDKARGVGGSRYPIGAIEFTKADWAAHYGEVWQEFREMKARFDPRNVLNPGPGIF